jgi:hypothetical protein
LSVAGRSKLESHPGIARSQLDWSTAVTIEDVRYADDVGETQIEGARSALHEFASQLRDLRRKAGPTYRQMVERGSALGSKPASAEGDALRRQIRDLRREMRALAVIIRLLLSVTVGRFSGTEIVRSLRHTVDSHRTRGPNPARKTSPFMVLFRELALI